MKLKFVMAHWERSPMDNMIWIWHEKRTSKIEGLKHIRYLFERIWPTANMRKRSNKNKRY